MVLNRLNILEYDLSGPAVILMNGNRRTLALAETDVRKGFAGIDYLWTELQHLYLVIIDDGAGVRYRGDYRLAVLDDELPDTLTTDLRQQPRSYAMTDVHTASRDLTGDLKYVPRDS